MEKADYYEYLNEDSCLYFANQAYTESAVQKDKMAQALAVAKIANAYQGKGEYEKATFPSNFMTMPFWLRP